MSVHCILIKISIATVIQIQVASVVSVTNGFINFWLHSLATRGERQFLKAYANHTMLNPPLRAVHLVLFKISAGRNPKNSTAHLNGRKLNYIFSKSSGPSLLVIHTPALFPVWGFIITDNDCGILSTQA